MWGNRLGWILSAVWVAIVLTAVPLLDRAARATTPPTSFALDPQRAAPIELPVAPETVVPQNSDLRDAGPVYRRAIEQYLKDPISYEQFLRTGRERDFDSVPAIATLLEASNAANADIFTSHPEEVVNYDGDRPRITALRTLAGCARRLAQLEAKHDPAEARKLCEATFTLGAHLYRERLIYAELDAGLSMMAEAAGVLRQVADANGEAPLSVACRQFDDARKPYVLSKLLPTQNVIGSVDQPTLEAHAGDVFVFARSAPERMWRVEAILKVGRYRFNAARVGDQREARRLLKELLKDPNPIIQTAAKAASELTVEQYRMLK